MIRKKNVFIAVVFLASLFFLPACSTLMGPTLVKAIDEGQLAEVDRMLATGVNPNEETKEGVTPLFVASGKGYDKLVKRFIDSKADVNAAVKKIYKHKGQTIYKGTTPLMAALENNHFDIAELLISNGASVKFSDENGLSPLMIASAKKNKQMVETLIDKGAKVNNATSSPFEYNGETIFSGTTPLMAAISGNRDENASILMGHGADINAKCKNGVDALIVAAVNGNAEMVKTLLKKGADPKTKTTQDFTIKKDPALVGADALIAAADKGSVEIVKGLIKAGADVNSVTKIGFTALMAASAKGHLEVVKILIANGADIKAKTTEKLTIGKDAVPKGSVAISVAAFNGHANVVQFLISKGANVNAKDEEYLLDPLFLASAKGHYDTAKILIQNGADVFAVSDHGTALNAANHYGHQLIAKMILKARDKANKEKEQTKEQD